MWLLAKHDFIKHFKIITLIPLILYVWWLMIELSRPETSHCSCSPLPGVWSAGHRIHFHIFWQKAHQEGGAAPWHLHSACASARLLQAPRTVNLLLSVFLTPQGIFSPFLSVGPHQFISISPVTAVEVFYSLSPVFGTLEGSSLRKALPCEIVCTLMAGKH